MLIIERLKSKKLTTLRRMNEELKQRIIKENGYDLRVAEELEEEIYVQLLNSKYRKEEV